MAKRKAKSLLLHRWDQYFKDTRRTVAGSESIEEYTKLEKHTKANTMKTITDVELGHLQSTKER